MIFDWDFRLARACLRDFFQPLRIKTMIYEVKDAHGNVVAEVEVPDEAERPLTLEQKPAEPDPGVGGGGGPKEPA